MRLAPLLLIVAALSLSARAADTVTATMSAWKASPLILEAA